MEGDDGEDKKQAPCKVWVRTPDENTQHTQNDGQTVPLDKKFIVVNDKTPGMDYDEVEKNALEYSERAGKKEKNAG